ncbi:MAG: NAD(P)H-hydrate dehydratase [Clostridiales Family XIII bacterium]|jgi:NAD(P)H-hydrate epimerase|nr:NAD(P)H-hydrate dehydratase [Clostridiales Family XIII bacterium]
MLRIERNYIKALLRPRPAASHKGDYGRLLVVAGSHGMAGAAALCARGAFRGGAGLVKVATEPQLFLAVHAAVPEATCLDESLLRNAPDRVLAGVSAAAAGPGLGVTTEAKEIVEVLLTRFEGTLILDADALNVAARDASALKEARASVIITPHTGEAARLLGVSTKEVDGDRAGAAADLARLTGATVALKGNGTLVARGGDVYLNATGNPGMATGGSGDVLTGVIAAFAGQGMGTLDAAMAGVHVHGLAGDIAAERVGEYGLMASDIAEAVAAAIKAVMS